MSTAQYTIDDSSSAVSGASAPDASGLWGAFCMSTCAGPGGGGRGEDRAGEASAGVRPQGARGGSPTQRAVWRAAARLHSQLGLVGTAAALTKQIHQRKPVC